MAATRTLRPRRINPKGPRPSTSPSTQQTPVTEPNTAGTSHEGAAIHAPDQVESLPKGSTTPVKDIKDTSNGKRRSTNQKKDEHKPRKPRKTLKQAKQAKQVVKHESSTAESKSGEAIEPAPAVDLGMESLESHAADMASVLAGLRRELLDFLTTTYEEAIAADTSFFSTLPSLPSQPDTDTDTATRLRLSHTLSLRRIERLREIYGEVNAVIYSTRPSLKGKDIDTDAMQRDVQLVEAFLDVGRNEANRRMRAAVKMKV